MNLTFGDLKRAFGALPYQSELAETNVLAVENVGTEVFLDFDDSQAEMDLAAAQAEIKTLEIEIRELNDKTASLIRQLNTATALLAELQDADALKSALARIEELESENYTLRSINLASRLDASRKRRARA